MFIITFYWRDNTFGRYCGYLFSLFILTDLNIHFRYPKRQILKRGFASHFKICGFLSNIYYPQLTAIQGIKETLPVQFSPNFTFSENQIEFEVQDQA